MTTVTKSRFDRQTIKKLAKLGLKERREKCDARCEDKLVEETLEASPFDQLNAREVSESKKRADETGRLTSQITGDMLKFKDAVDNTESSKQALLEYETKKLGPLTSIKDQAGFIEDNQSSNRKPSRPTKREIEAAFEDAKRILDTLEFSKTRIAVLNRVFKIYPKPPTKIQRRDLQILRGEIEGIKSLADKTRNRREIAILDDLDSFLEYIADENNQQTFPDLPASTRKGKTENIVPDIDEYMSNLATPVGGEWGTPSIKPPPLPPPSSPSGDYDSFGSSEVDSTLSQLRRDQDDDYDDDDDDDDSTSTVKKGKTRLTKSKKKSNQQKERNSIGDFFMNAGKKTTDFNSEIKKGQSRLIKTPVQSRKEVVDDSPMNFFNKSLLARRSAIEGRNKIRQQLQANDQDDDDDSDFGDGLRRLAAGSKRQMTVDPATGRMGKLKFDMDKLHSYNIRCMKGRKLACKGICTPGLYNLLTKHGNVRNCTDDDIEDYKRLVHLAEIQLPKVPDTQHKKKLVMQGLEQKPQSNSRAKYVYFNNVDELVDRLEVLMGSKNSGNNSSELVEEIIQIAEILKNNGAFSQIDFVNLVDSLM